MTREEMERVADAARVFLAAHERRAETETRATLNEETTFYGLHRACSDVTNGYRATAQSVTTA